MEEKTLTQRIKEICEDKNISISTMEKDLDFSAGLISRWEKNTPSVDRVVAVAKYLETSTDYLLGMKNENNVQSLNEKFIVKLIVDTLELNVKWAECGEGYKLPSTVIAEVCVEQTERYMKPEPQYTYCLTFETSFIYLSKKPILSKEENDCAYLLFIEFDVKKVGEKDNYAIISYEDGEYGSLELLYSSINKHIKNGTSLTKRKSLMEAYVYKDEGKYHPEEIISGRYSSSSSIGGSVGIKYDYPDSEIRNRFTEYNNALVNWDLNHRKK